MPCVLECAQEVTMTTIEDRVSRLEGAYEHLATKADIAELKADIAVLKDALTWRLIGAIAIASSIIIGVVKLWN